MRQTNEKQESQTIRYETKTEKKFVRANKYTITRVGKYR